MAVDLKNPFAVGLRNLILIASANSIPQNAFHYEHIRSSRNHRCWTIADGTASEALVHIRNASAADCADESEIGSLVEHNGRWSLRVGGIAIDGFYRVVGENGKTNNRIHDIAFPHATGIRPYSYGLQACETAASIVVQRGARNQLVAAFHLPGPMQ